MMRLKLQISLMPVIIILKQKGQRAGTRQPTFLKIDSVSLYLQIKLLHHLRAATHKDGFSFGQK